MRCSRISLLALAGLFTGFVGVGTAQRPSDGPEQLIYAPEVDKLDTNMRIELDNYLSGRKQPPADAKRLFDLAARVYVWRVSMPFVQMHPEAMENVRAGFRREIGIAVSADKDNKEAVRQWAPQLVSAFKKVFALPLEKNRLTCVNAAVLLPDLARLKQPVITDFLVDLVKDEKKNDAVRMWAAKALKEAPPATEYISINITKEGKAAEQRKAVDLKRVQALSALFGREWVAPKQRENESKAAYEKRLHEYEDGFRWVREGAIEGLAATRVPAIEADAKTKKLTAPVVPMYLRVLTKDSGLSPEPALHEKLEAAIAVCMINVDANSIYQPEEAIYRLGTFLVELGDVYKVDYDRSKGKGGQLPMTTWRVHGKRLQSALGELVQSVSANPLHQGAAENARKLERAAKLLIDAIQGQAAFNRGGDLANAVNGLRPSSNQIFKGIAPAAGSGE